MLVLRCTSRLLDRLKAKPDPAPPASTTRPGDLYANLLHIGRTQLVLAVSERTFLPALVPAAPANTLIPRLRDGILEVLRALDVSEGALREEQAAMGTVAIGKTANRQVIGVMVEFAKALEWTWDSHPTLLDASLFLGRMVCMPLKPDPFPDKVTKRLFAGQ